jgi:tyrosyl-tRNA synthetase
MAASNFPRAASKAAKKCINDPHDLDDAVLLTPLQFRNPGRSRYALPPPSISLPIEERIIKIRHLIDHYGSECISEDELMNLLENCESPVAYDGFEPSGRMHIAQGLMKKHFVNTLTDCGFTYLFWIADWFAVLNLKLGGDLEKIQMVGRYMIEVWRALGMNMDRVRFLWASEEFSTHSDIYWARVLDISTKNTLKRIQRCGQIMGRSDSGLQASQIFYPCMQAADVFFLGVDVCQLGLDQRKVNMLVREYADASGLPKPAVLSHPMCPGLKRGQPKMSKSIPDTAIFMEDTPEEVKRKIDSAFCPVD